MKKVFENRSVVVKQSIVKQPKTGEKLLRAGIRKAFLSTLLLSPVLAHALGLGALTTNSSLNEPFDARIELLNTSSEELQTLSVTLGGVEQFKNAGIERPFLLSSLKFVIIEDLAGSYLQITSDESIKEPFLNFLLEVNWAKGRLIREYTALLDPPVFDTNTRIADTTEMAVSEPEMPIAVTEPVPTPTPAPVTPAPVQPEKENIRIEQLPDATLVSDAEVQSGSMVESNTVSTTTIPVAEPVSHEEPVVYQETFQQQRSQPSFSGDNYTTSRGDTLWDIARQSRPSRSVSVQQMMLSLLNTNPGAFVNNNINVLKTGQVLRIPDSSEINQLSKREAIALVKEHNALWDDYRQGLASNVAPRPAGAVSSVGTVVESEVVEEEIIEEPEVRLVTATMDDVTVFEEAATGSGDVNESMTEDVLENDLALANEQLVSGQSENAELRDKLRESEEITELLKQQVALKNQELAALQQKLREANIAKPESETVYLENEEAAKPDEVKEPEVAEEVKPEIEEEPEVAEEPKPEESIDDILAELEQGKEPESETVYLEHSEELTSTTTDYGSYNAPAESLAGKEMTTVYFDADDATTPVEPVQSDVTETPAVAEVETEQPVEEVVVDEPQAETGLLDKITAMLPAGIVDSVPGGIKTVLAVILGLLGLLLVGVLKIFGGKGKENAEILDLLDPEELDDTEDVFSTTLDDITDEIVPDELLDQETVEVAADSFDAKVAEEFDLDFEEEITDDFTPDATGEIEIPDLLDDDAPEELESSEGLVNLEDTLEQIKPLLEQTEEELEEDPLEEVNLSLAYEQFDKAETLVNQAIKDHPEEDGYKLRLLEVHYAANNKEAYEDAAKSLHEAIGGEGHLWESAVAMWSEMSPERDLFEDAEPEVADVSSTETLETTTPTESPVSENEEEDEEDGVFDISSGTKGIIAGMSAAGVGIGAAILGSDDSEDDNEFINIADETTSLEDTEMIDISAGEVETPEVEDDFLNIAETGEVEDDFLNIAGEETGDSLLDQTQPNVEEDLSIDMLDITAVGSTDADTDTGDIDIAVDADIDTDAEELFELTNEFKTVDENILSATSVESEESAEILEFSSDDVAEITKESLDVEPTADVDVTEEALSLDGDDDLESLAKSLEDTISGLDTGGLDDLTFEFDPDGTLESTLTSTLGVASDIDLENEGDEIDTKLNLAKAYIELGDSDGAKDILQEVSSDGSDDQKKDALDLLQQIS